MYVLYLVHYLGTSLGPLLPHTYLSHTSLSDLPTSRHCSKSLMLTLPFGVFSGKLILRSFTTLGKMQSTLCDFALNHMQTIYLVKCVIVQLILLYFNVPDDGLAAFKSSVFSPSLSSGSHFDLQKSKSLLLKGMAPYQQLASPRTEKDRIAGPMKDQPNKNLHFHKIFR